jgi:hypothetical protein
MDWRFFWFVLFLVGLVGCVECGIMHASWQVTVALFILACFSIVVIQCELHK